MRTQRTPLLLATIAAYAFGRNACDPFAIPDPDIGGGSSICGITQRGVGNERCHAPDDGSNGGNSAKKIELTQEELDAIVQKRVGPLQEKLKAKDALDAKVAELEKRLGEADAEKAKAAEEAELKGKSELDVMKIQLQKATEKSKVAEAEWQKRIAEATAQAESAAKDKQDYVRRHLVTSALNDAGLAKGAGKAAAMAFLAEAQIELTETQDGHKSIAVGGKSFDKPADAAKHFLTENPYFAAAPAGGAGTPRNANGGGTASVDQHTSLEGLLAAGLQQRAAS